MPEYVSKISKADDIVIKLGCILTVLLMELVAQDILQRKLTLKWLGVVNLNPPVVFQKMYLLDRIFPANFMEFPQVV